MAIFMVNLTEENGLFFISNMQTHTGKDRGTKSNPVKQKNDFKYKEIGLLDTLNFKTRFLLVQLNYIERFCLSLMCQALVGDEDSKRAYHHLIREVFHVSSISR